MESELSDNKSSNFNKIALETEANEYSVQKIINNKNDSNNIIINNLINKQVTSYPSENCNSKNMEEITPLHDLSNIHEGNLKSENSREEFNFTNENIEDKVVNISCISIKDVKKETLTGREYLNPHSTTEENLMKLLQLTKRSHNKSVKSARIKNSCISSLIENPYEITNATIQIKNHEDYTNLQLSKLMFDLIHENTHNDVVVIFPPRFISLPYLIINKNVKFVGSPGNLIEINNGVIHICSNTNTRINVSFNECSFIFNVDVNIFLKVMQDEKFNKFDILKLQDKSYYAHLLNVTSDSNIEINDCDFRAVVHKGDTLIDGNNSINAILLYSKNTDTNFYINSSIISNFYNAIELYNINLIKIDSSHISDNTSNAIYVYNTKSFAINNSFISNNLKGLEILNNYLQNSIINIMNCEIYSNKIYGVKIHSDVDLPSKNTIEVSKNILHSNNIGILFENLYIQKLFLISNEFIRNNEIGLKLFNLSYFDDKSISLKNPSIISNIQTVSIFFSKSNFDFENFNGIYILKNQYNENNLGLLIDRVNNIVLNIDENVISSNKNGISLTKLTNYLVNLKYNQIFDNEENGLLLTEFNLISSIKIFKCKFSNNKSTGIYISNKDKLEDGFPQISLKNCEISLNRKRGIHLKNFILNLENTKINYNSEWAIEIPLKSNKKLLVFINYNMESIEFIINNDIGGKWGSVLYKKSRCSTGTCYIL